MNQNEILNAQVKDLETQQATLSEVIAQITLDCEYWDAKRDQSCNKKDTGSYRLEER